MPLWALGINHKSASVELREKLAFSPDKLESAHADLCEHVGISEAVILSTCNRTEIIAHGDVTDTQLLNWLANYHELQAGEMDDVFFTKQGQQAVAHAMKVASGLDSLVLGEPQILGQVKSAYAVAQQAGTVAAYLHALFQQVFSAAKQVRTETAIGSNPVSVAYSAVYLSQRIFADLKDTSALLIGAGETIDLVAQHLHQQGVRSMVVANRTLERAQELAERFGASAVLLSDIPDELAKADIVISSTASQLPVLGKGTVETAMKARKHRPQFMVDIAVPRDIEPEVADLDDVYLYTVDDLREVIEEGQKARQEAAREAERIVDQNVTRFLEGVRSRDAVGVIRQYRDRSEQIKAAELQKALSKLSRGDDPEQVVAELARSLTNKLIHDPTVALSRASGRGKQDVIEQAVDLLGLDTER